MSAAPALAASPCTSPVRTPSTANGWTSASSNMQTNGSNGFNGTGYILSSDPRTGAASVTVTSPTFTFDAGRTYTFGYSYTSFNGNARDLVLTISYAGITLPTLTLDTDLNPLSGTKTASFTPALTTSGAIVFLYTFSVVGINNGGDDITMTNFTVTCT